MPLPPLETLVSTLLGLRINADSSALPFRTPWNGLHFVYLSLALLLNCSLCPFPSCHSESLKPTPNTPCAFPYCFVYTGLYYHPTFYYCLLHASQVPSCLSFLRWYGISSLFWVKKVNPFGSIIFYNEILSLLVNHFFLELSELYWCCLTIYQGKEYSVIERKRREWKRVRCQKENHGDAACFSRNNHGIPSFTQHLNMASSFHHFDISLSRGVNRLWARAPGDP